MNKKSKLQLLYFVFLLIIVNANKIFAAPANPKAYYIDTSNLVIRICVGDLPAYKKNPGGDYIPVLCAYNYIKEKLITYKVAGFDLIYKDGNNSKIFTSTRNTLYTMRDFLITLDSTSIHKVFFDNVKLINPENANDTIIAKGLRPFIHKKEAD